MKKLFIILILNTLYVILYAFIGVSPVSASPRYPVKDLDSCRNANECYLYCQIPTNTPACWSYGKFVLSPQILGVSTVLSATSSSAVNIAYPVAELGNCTGTIECANFCKVPANYPACATFAKSKGIQKDNATPAISSKVLSTAKTELGCDSLITCIALCDQPENQAKCQTFIQKNTPLNSSPTPTGAQTDIINKAKSELGCDSQSSCLALCGQPQNFHLCRKFAQSYGLTKVDPKVETETRKSDQFRTRLLNEARTVLGCNSQEACTTLCREPNNQTRCHDLYRRVMAEIVNGINQPNFTGAPSTSSSGATCASEKECREFCVKNPALCPGYIVGGNNATQTGVLQSPPATLGVYLGPAGCRTEAQCQNYCQSHPMQCPGYPKPTPQITANPSPLPYIPEK